MSIIIQGMAPLLQVFEMTVAINFYRNKLGFKVIQQVPEGDDCDWALLGLEGVELMLNTAYEKDNRPPYPDPDRIASHSDTIIFFNCPDVDAAYNFLLENGVSIQKPAISHYGYKSLNVTDPDGYKLCFHWPNS